uniref:protein phosphatase 1 regulatory subunit 3C-B n=1 Tax=Doryrhamphus excisus TaxID=161450 RepID=UPI0025AE4041|nr:protein phosphatase 1 regulatory subunit 3C-B [Doryrhamphus excisus]
MNCTRVLQAFGSHPQPTGLPVDLVVCLSQRRPLFHLLSMKPTFCHYEPPDGPQRTSFHSSRQSLCLSSSPMSSERRSCLQRNGSNLNKKRVVFADAKGLALTAVRLFVPDSFSLASTPPMDVSSTKHPGSNKPHRHKYRLGFPQPTLDLKAFLSRLRETYVQLESCNISEHSLSGKVHIFHGSTDKAVYVRVTFDSWWHHYDIPCVFLQQQRCCGTDVDVFAFDLSLPLNVDPVGGVEFCVSFRPGGSTSTHWDNNRGQNYKVHVEMDAGEDYRNTPIQRPPYYRSVQNSADLGIFRTGSHFDSGWVGKHCPTSFHRPTRK